MKIRLAIDGEEDGEGMRRDKSEGNQAQEGRRGEEGSWISISSSLIFIYSVKFVCYQGDSVVISNDVMLSEAPGEG